MLFRFASSSCAHGCLLSENGVKVAIGRDLAPFSFMGLNGEPKGFFIDYWEKWSEKTGVPVTFVPATFGESLDLVRTGECDIIAGLLMNDERQEYLDYSAPIHRVKAVILVNNDEGVKTETALSSMKVGVVARGYAEYYLKTNYPDIHLKELIHSAFLSMLLLAVISSLQQITRFLSVRSGNTAGLAILHCKESL